MSVLCPDCREFVAVDKRCKTCEHITCDKCDVKHVCQVEAIRRELVKIAKYAHSDRWLVDSSNFSSVKWVREIDPVSLHNFHVTWHNVHGSEKYACALAVEKISIDDTKRFSVIIDGEFADAQCGVDFRVFSVPFEILVTSERIVFASPPINGRVFLLELRD